MSKLFIGIAGILSKFTGSSAISDSNDACFTFFRISLVLSIRKQFKRQCMAKNTQSREVMALNVRSSPNKLVLDCKNEMK